MTAKLTRDVRCITYPHVIRAGTPVWVDRECRPGVCSAWMYADGKWVAIAVPTDALAPT